MNVKSYNITGLKADTTYTYRVTAYNSEGESVAVSKSFSTQPVITTLLIITTPNLTDGSIVNKRKEWTTIA